MANFKYRIALWLWYLFAVFSLEDIAFRSTSFWQATIFQWANPKAWVMAIVGVTTYVPMENFFINISVMIGLYMIFVFCSGGMWTLFGNWIQRFLHRPHYLRIFNISMAILLVISLFPLMQESIK